ncbi:MAG TPA: hypothetical protein VM263_03195 [Acidimicrobiales bacterium]|nr:hypothetical protein [Acidimicrobiales bacterium]
MVSDRGRLQWGAYVQARARDNGVLPAGDELNRFLVGLHMRGEVLAAAELASLLDEAGLEGAERDGLVERIQWGLSLLDAYAHQLDLEESAYEEVHEHGGFEI